MPYIDDLPAKSAVFDHWKDRLRSIGVFIDWGEPSCWACGFHYSTKYDISNPSASYEQILKGWDKIPLQRCHIVPRSLGGSNGVENLFLMCRECHDTAPNTPLPEIFFEWAKHQSWHRRESNKLLAAFESFGVEPEQHEKISDILQSVEFAEWSRDRVGFHRPQSNYAPISSKLTPATYIGLAVFFDRERKIPPP